MRSPGLLAILLLLPLAGAAQGVPGGMSTLALLWAQGNYRAPMICEIEGQPRRALRRLVIRTGPRTATRALDRLTLFDLEAPEATRCYGEAGNDQPNLIGSLTLVYDGRDDPDLAKRDFEDRLRREGGFTFRIFAGRLRIGAPGAPAESLETVDFKDGTVTLEAVRRGSDAFRRLAEFGPRDKRVLHLAAPDGRRWSLDLVEWSAVTGPR
ncbi:MAG: hypothetical protein QF410_15465 [Planctomycetota bacterium]|jgi:hypothetical protein|nr:hypothetical protein [Planctomycetota bacterium]